MNKDECFILGNDRVPVSECPAETQALYVDAKAIDLKMAELDNILKETAGAYQKELGKKEYLLQKIEPVIKKIIEEKRLKAVAEKIDEKAKP